MSYCPFCLPNSQNIRFATYSNHKIHTEHIIKEHNSLTDKVSNSNCENCVGCNSLILKREVNPITMYSKFNLCCFCKSSSSLYCKKGLTLKGPQKLCVDCQFKDIAGIKTRLNIIKEYASVVKANSRFRLCPSCFTPIQRISGCRHIICSVCSHDISDIDDITYFHANISDNELKQIIGCQLPYETQFNDMYKNNIIRERPRENIISTPSCGMKYSHNTSIVNNKIIPEKPKECPICVNEKDCHLIQPCKHWCCLDCIIKTKKQECPFCRSNFVAYLLKSQTN